MRFRTLLFAAALLAVPCALLAAPVPSLTLNLGGATSNPDRISLSDGTNTCPMAQAILKVKHVGPFNLSGEVRNAFCTADKRELYNKSRYCLGAELPLASNMLLFCSYERAYHQNDDWAWAGVSFRFGK